MFGDEVVEAKVLIKEEFQSEAQAIPLDIIYEDDDILVINKSRGLVVHPGAGNLYGTMFNALLYYFPSSVDVPRAGIVHRLDKDTTGLMVVAKTVLAQKNLIKSLQAHNIIREYEAIVVGITKNSGTIEQPLARHALNRIRMAVHPMGKQAITYYHVIEKFRAHTHLRIRLKTGRTHQIRVHMAHINHPLVGDQLYGKRLPLLKNSTETFKKELKNFNRQALHSTLLRLYHPVRLIEMEWCIPLPQDMVGLITLLRMDNKS